MVNTDNLLFGSLAVDLRLVSQDLVTPLLRAHLESANGTFENALVAASHLTPEESARIRQEMARLLRMHGNDAERALESVDRDGTFGALLNEGAGPMSSHLMPTLQGAPVTGIQLTEAINLAAAEEQGRYSNSREYGRGGMGRILVVHDEFLSRDVALKELIPKVDAADKTLVGANSAAESAHLVERFLREARITGNLEHPSIVPVYELGRRPDGAHYYTMKLVRGKTLHRAIQDAQNLADRMKLLPHLIDLCQAIAYAHSKGVIHRDIKPANVMVGSFGETVVIDWGLARVLNQDDPYAADLAAVMDGPLDSPSPAQTMAGMPVGTPHYMSPEQADGRLDDVGTHSDVYALGVALYEVLTGKTPFTGTSTRVVLNQVRSTRPIPVTAHEPEIPPALGRICAKAMERRPADRYGSAAELAAELIRFSTGALVRSYHYNPWELLRHYYRQHRALCNTVLGATAVVLVVAVASYISILEANRKERIQRKAAEVARYAAEGEAYRANIQVVSNDIKIESFQNARERLLLQPVEQRNWEWGLLFEQCNQDLATAVEHQSPVHHLIGAPSSERLISVGMGGEVFVWSTPYLELLHQFDLPRFPVAALALSPGGERLAIARMDGVVDVFDFRDYTRVCSFKKDVDSFNSLVFSGDGQRVAAGSNDGNLYVWHTADGSEVRRFKGHDGECYVFGMNHDGNVLLSSDAKGQTVVWDIAAGVEQGHFAGTRPAFSADGQCFALLADGQIRVYDLETTELKFQAQPDSQPYSGLLLSPDGRRVATRVGSDTVRIWDVDTRDILSSFRIGKIWRLLDYSPDGQQVAVAVLPNSVEVRNVRDGSLIRTLQGHSNHVENARYSGSGDALFTCAGDTEIKAWRLPGPSEPPPPDPGRRITDLAWSEATGILAAGTMGGTVQFLAGNDLSPVLTLASFEPRANSRVALNPAGDRAILSLSPTTIFEVGLPGGDVLAQHTAHTDTITDLAYSPKSDAFASASQDRTVRIWPADAAEEALVFGKHPDEVLALAFAPDNRRIVSGDRSGNMLVWDWHTGFVEQTEHVAEFSINVIDVDFTGTSTACALADNTIRIYSLDPGTPPRTLLGHDSTVVGLAFSSDGRRLISASGRGELKIWDVETGQELLSMGDNRVLSEAIALDRSHIYVGGGDGMAAIVSSFPPSLFGYKDPANKDLAQYKRNRGYVPPYVDVASRPKKVETFVPLEDFRDIVARIQSATQPDPSALEREYLEPPSNPLARLGLRTGDAIVVANGLPCTSFSAVLDQLDAVLNEQDYVRNGLDLEIRRGTRKMQFRYYNAPIAITKLSFSIPRDQALGLLQGTSDLLRRFESSIVDFSHRNSKLTGAEIEGRTALDGLWIPPPSSQSDVDTLRAFALSDGNRIVAVNGRPIVDYAELLETVGSAIGAIQAGRSGTAEIVVERDVFQRLVLELSVQ